MNRFSSLVSPDDGQCEGHLADQNMFGIIISDWSRSSRKIFWLIPDSCKALFDEEVNHKDSGG